MYRLRRSETPGILLSLLERPKHLRGLQAEVEFPNGGNALKELIKEGLIQKRESKEWPFRKMLKFTPEGGRGRPSSSWRPLRFPSR
ncbi:MAG: hypothetical protein QW179_04740 [Candidatus Hadarchaeales archaeon]